jgi:excisionase family DNA binding protein
MSNFSSSSFTASGDDLGAGDAGWPAAGRVPARPDPRMFMSIAEVAALFGRAPRTVRWWLAEGRLPVVRVGRAKFIPRAAVERLVGGMAPAFADTGDDGDGFDASEGVIVAVAEGGAGAGSAGDGAGGTANSFVSDSSTIGARGRGVS